MPAYVAFSVLDTLNTAQMAKTVFAAFGPPYVVKPPREGSSNGLRIVDTLIDLPDVIGDALDAYGSVLIEQFVSGEEVSAGVIEGFRNQELYVLPPAHVRLPVGDRTIESHHHHDASTRIIVPSRFSNTDKRHMEDMARTAHTMLAMSHFSYANMIKTPRATYLLDVDAVPGLYEGAPFPAMLESVGSSVADFLEHSIRLARMPR